MIAPVASTSTPAAEELALLRAYCEEQFHTLNGLLLSC